MENGLIQVYTGPGKGKTTAAIGQAIRAIGHGLEVCVIYFYKMPSRWGYEELRVLEDLGVEIHGFAKKHPHFFKEIGKEKMREESLKGLKHVEEIFDEETLDIIILDEIIIGIRDGFLREKELLEVLEKKPEGTELILTGRGASESLIEKADLVSKVENVKHHFDEGVECRPGIEF